MTAEHSADPGRQRTVAELLRQYGGGEAGSSGRRRRRRGARIEPEEPDPRPPSPAEEPPSAAEQTWSSFSALAQDDPPPRPTRPANAEPESLWTDYRSPGLSGYVPRGGAGGYELGSPSTSGYDSGSYSSRGSSLGYERGGYGSAPSDHYQSGGGAGSEWARPVDWTASVLDRQPADSAPPGPGEGYPGGFDQPAEERTDLLPRYSEQADSGPATEEMPRTELGLGTARRTVEDSGPDTVVSSRAELFSDDVSADDAADDVADDAADGSADADGRGETSAGAEEAAAEAAEPAASARLPIPAAARRLLNRAMPDVPAGLAPGDLDEYGEPDVDAAGDQRDKAAVEGSSEARSSGTAPGHGGAEAAELSGAKAWAVLIGQGVGGAVGGALLWVGFRFLWLNVPILALLAAVVATVGLVLVVRAIRGSDELQTTLLAVLVGLVVTISPAVLLLTTR